MRTRYFGSMALPAALWLAAAVTAVAAPAAADIERQARELETRLVAPCCWSQQVSVHQSPAADSVRKDLRTRLGRGETSQAILDDYVVQFGERILVEPPARGYKLLLYVFPPVALVLSGAGLTVLVRRFARNRTSATDGPTAASARASTDPYRDRLDEELRDLD
jgi:cytochrome c-type biogenesis protein CcmH